MGVDRQSSNVPWGACGGATVKRTYAPALCTMQSIARRKASTVNCRLLFTAREDN